MKRVGVEGGGGVELDGVCIVLAVSKDAKCQLSIQLVCPNIVCPSQIICQLISGGKPLT